MMLDFLFLQKGTASKTIEGPECLKFTRILQIMYHLYTFDLKIKMHLKLEPKINNNR